VGPGREARWEELRGVGAAEGGGGEAWDEVEARPRNRQAVERARPGLARGPPPGPAVARVGSGVWHLNLELRASTRLKRINSVSIVFLQRVIIWSCRAGVAPGGHDSRFSSRPGCSFLNGPSNSFGHSLETAWPFHPPFNGRSNDGRRQLLYSQKVFGCSADGHNSQRRDPTQQETATDSPGRPWPKPQTARARPLTVRTAGRPLTAVSSVTATHGHDT